MQIENTAYYLGKRGEKTYLVWNIQNSKEFQAKNLQDAIDRAKEIIIEFNKK